VKRRGHLAVATIALAAAASPVQAFEWTVPASFHLLSLKGAENHDFMGLAVPVIWLGGPIGPLALHFAGGYAYQRERLIGDSYNFVTLQASLNLEVPIGPLVPYVGVEGQGWYPIDARGYLHGIPLMAAPHAGLRFSLLGLAGLDVWAFGLPGMPDAQNVWNVSDGAGRPYVGSTLGAGARFTLNL